MKDRWADPVIEEAVLRGAGERFQQLAENLEEMIWLVDLDRMRALYVSPAFDRIWERSRESLYEGLDVFWSSVLPEDVGSERNARIDLLAEGEREFRIRRPDGTLRWVRSRSFPLSTEDGRGRSIAGICEDVTEVREARARVRRAAMHDVVTGLPTRTSFLDRLRRSLERMTHQANAGCAILFIDIDGFKVVNNSLGYAHGDRLLEAVGQRLTDCLRPEDMVARHGSDEFAIMLHNTAHATDTARVAQRVLRALDRSFRLGTEDVFITASIGIVVGAGYRSAEEMVRDADIAMTRAKASGPGSFRVFDPEMHAEAVSRLRQETDLRMAVERGEFHLCFQPIVSLADQQLCGFEALVRWEHPQRGLVMARDFVPTAERMGLIRPIGRWALTEACRQMEVWRASFPRLAKCMVNVNLSARQIANPEIVDHVREALERAAMDPARLALEITETALLAHSEEALVRLAELKSLGVRLHLDDFGTGYSALSYLSRLPVDAMKIDRSFVRGLDEEKGVEIIQAIRNLGAVLNMEVVAEGVETPAQLEALRAIGCEYAQGFLFGHPFTSDQAERFIEDRSAKERA